MWLAENSKAKNRIISGVPGLRAREFRKPSMQSRRNWTISEAVALRD